jgi:hypothetical protein
MMALPASPLRQLRVGNNETVPKDGYLSVQSLLQPAGPDF